MRSAVVVVVDRLGAGFLGPYGNTWVDTPQFNRLASESLVCETALADSPDVKQACRAWWSGRHALELVTSQTPGLPLAARESGRLTSLVSSDLELVTDGFGDHQFVSSPTPGKRAEELEQTAIGALFVEAARRVSELREPSLLWIHSSGMSGPWDAPLALRQQFADEDDPDPPDFLEPPALVLPDGFDPDEQLGMVQAYAGQVALVDVCLGLLLDALQQSPLADETLLAVTSPRGYPLGEHRHVGGNSLYGELLHVPLFVRLPGGCGGSIRSQGLVQPCDLHATLSEWLQLPAAAKGLAQSLMPAAAGEVTEGRRLAIAKSETERAIRSPAWLLRESQTADGEVRRELFAKPDDRWEANEVSSRCGDVVELLAAAGDQFEQFAAGQLASLPPLAEILCETRR
jgi:hypothetical protein